MFHIVKGDITQCPVDGIVNAANPSLLGGGGVDGAIHKAAGPGLLEECKKLKGCPTGQARITDGYQLKAKKVIHTVGPIYQDGLHRESYLLRSAYQSSLDLAKENGLKTLAFPLISGGVYGYPLEGCMTIAIESLQEGSKDFQDIYLVLFTEDLEEMALKIQKDGKKR